MKTTCRAFGCARAPYPSLYCERHWRMVPGALQHQVWVYYNPQASGSGLQAPGSSQSPAFLHLSCLCQAKMALKDGYSKMALGFFDDALLWRLRSRNVDLPVFVNVEAFLVGVAKGRLGFTEVRKARVRQTRVPEDRGY